MTMHKESSDSEITDFLKSPSLLISGSGGELRTRLFFVLPQLRFRKKNSELALWASLVKSLMITNIMPCQD